MGAQSKIEWTDATWNPVVGCRRVSPKCQHCYAETMAKRLRAMGRPEYQDVHDGRGWTGRVSPVPERLEQPLRWRKPRRIFVGSMTDLFHESVPFEFIAAAFGVMAACPQHTFQVLTKRPARMAAFFAWIRDAMPSNPGGPARGALWYAWSGAGGRVSGGLDETAPSRHKPWTWPLPNVWLGVSVEDQRRADERGSLLSQVPAAVRFLSMEPLLGPVDITRHVDGLQRMIGDDTDGWAVEDDPSLRIWDTAADARAELGGEWWREDGRWYREVPRIHWVIVGSERVAGKPGRDTDLAWVRDLRDQCASAGVPFFLKQLPDGVSVVANPELDGRTHQEFPHEFSR